MRTNGSGRGFGGSAANASGRAASRARRTLHRVIRRAAATVVSVNVGQPRTVEWHGQLVRTGIWKAPVDGLVRVEGVNLVGDGQADRRVHGGPDKAVYAYAVEDYEWWSGKLGRELAPATFGENLTVTGIDLGSSTIGTRWHVGGARLEVAQPRLPCFKLGIRMGDASFVERFEHAARFGAYLRIVEAGDVGAGDAIDVETGPSDGITVRELGCAEHVPAADLVERILADPHVPVRWKEWAQRRQRGDVE
jgi:MOSC domain-containing protein YiiM